MADHVELTMEQASTTKVSSTPEVKSSTPLGRAEVIIHVRFHPNGLVNTVNHRPDRVSPQDWFDLLCRAAPSSYQALAGGRGVFRIRNEFFDALWQDHEI